MSIFTVGLTHAVGTSAKPLVQLHYSTIILCSSTLQLCGSQKIVPIHNECLCFGEQVISSAQGSEVLQILNIRNA